MSRRSVPVTTPRLPSRASCTPGVRTGCELTSTNTWCPAPISCSTASVRCTVWRRLVYQYSASVLASFHSPVTVERNLVCGVCGVMVPRSLRMSSRMSSTWAECEA